MSKVSIVWKDGLPDDPLERAQIEQILKTAGLTSTYSSIKRLHDGDGAAAQEELKRIEEERAQPVEPQAPQETEEAPAKEALFKAEAERGMRGTANDRG